MPPFSIKPATDAPLTIFVTHEYAPFRGGVATYVREVARAAQGLGLPVAVWTVDYHDRTDLKISGQPHFRECADPFPVVRLRSDGRLTPWGLLNLVVGLWRRRTELAGNRVVLASVGAQMAFFLLSAVGMWPGRETTCLFHGSEVLRFQRNPLWRWLSRRYYQLEGVTIAATTHYVGKLLSESGLLQSNSKISPAPCALPTLFHVEQSVSKSAKSEGEHRRVLTVARLHPRKGQCEVAQALALLPPELKERVIYQLVGVGDESYRQEIEHTCRIGGITCEFLGALDDQILAQTYADATLYAQASRTLAQSVEGFGLTFLEAGIHGCPAAAWDSGGVSEAVLNGRTGLLAEEGNTAGLSVAIQKLLEDPALRRGLGEAAREHAQSFRWEDAARVLCSVAATG